MVEYANASPQSATNAPPGTVRKSQHDHREYRYLQLENRMKVLLVRDEATTKSAATLYVRSGSLNDPPEVNGIAHFCEHMLFLGTKKFPEPDGYSKFLTGNGGSRNAATGEDFTFFYFDVKIEALDEALDRFSDFFKAPAFTEEATQREIEAIESEFKKNVNSELRRVIQIEKTELSAEGSALKRFATGNLASLITEPEAKGLNIRESLLDYHSKHYSSNLMSLCIVGPNELAELEDMAKKHFASVEDKDAKLRDYSKDPMYDANALGHIVKYAPEKKSSMLSLKWPLLPSAKQYWEGSPLVYLGHLIGYEGHGSLLSELIKQGLAINLMAGANEKLQGQRGGFYIDITLTEEGMTEAGLRRVLRLVFAAINQFRKEGPQGYYMRERRVVGDLSF